MFWLSRQTMIMMADSAQGDCDDNNASVNPQASESEYVNGIDEDCDGIIDEGTEAFDDDGDGYTEQGGL